MSPSSAVHAELSGSPRENAGELRRLLAEREPGWLILPPGRHIIAGAIELTAGWSLHGSVGSDGEPQTRLVQASATEPPFVHVLGSDTAVRDLVLDVPSAHPGPHDGDRWTALTVGRYFYPATPEWIEDVTISGVYVVRAGKCPANSIAVMGAVRRLELTEVDIRGGGTGVAVHWGATGTGVTELTGASFHPHLLRIHDVRVSDAFEGFYLSSVHDVSVTRTRMDDVEIGFRLLPGDNTDRFHEHREDSPVSSRITVRDCEIGWNGDLYALRVAGWGRSEIDHHVTSLEYRDLNISDVLVRPDQAVATETADDSEGRVAVVVENAGSVAFERLRLVGSTGVVPVRLDGRDLPLSALTGATDTKS